MLYAIALLQSAAGPTPSATPPIAAVRPECPALAEADPAAARVLAQRGRIAGGGVPAERCAGLVEARAGRWAEAAERFEAAAQIAARGHDAMFADIEAQAGNAWPAARQPDKAMLALTAAFEAGTLKGQALGEVELDMARTAVATDALDLARGSIDMAVRDAAADPLAWLLSATLARRQNDVRRARTDIAEALKRSPDDASVQLEAGNIAALGGDEAGARAAWGEAARLAPDRAQGRAAVAALAQFDAPAAAPPATSSPRR